MTRRAKWERGEWLPRGAKKPRREYRWGNWVVSEGLNHEKRDAGLPWALTGPGHETYHRTAAEAKAALPEGA